MAGKKVSKASEKKDVKKPVKKASPKVIDISKFFNITREKEGVWYEPKINGVPLGLELKILGPSAEEVRKAAIEYDKAHEESVKMIKTDQGKALDMEQEALSKRAAAAVVDIRGANGNVIKIDGKPLVYSKEIIERLFFENGDITGDVLVATLNTDLFK